MRCYVADLWRQWPDTSAEQHISNAACMPVCVRKAKRRAKLDNTSCTLPGQGPTVEINAFPGLFATFTTAKPTSKRDQYSSGSSSIFQARIPAQEADRALRQGRSKSGRLCAFDWPWSLTLPQASRAAVTLGREHPAFVDASYTRTQAYSWKARAFDL